MRVLQVNSVCGRGSTGRIAVGIAERVRERGGRCTIAFGRDEALGWDDTLAIGSRADVVAHQLAARLADASGFGSTEATERFCAEVARRDYDLVHLHNVHGYYLDVEVMFNALKTWALPVVWTLHDCWAFTGHCAYFDYVGCERWRDSCGECPERLSYPRSLLVDNSPTNLARKKLAFSAVGDLTLVSPSRWLRDKAMQSFLRQYPCEVVPNEVDTALFSPTPSDVRERLGLIGRHVVLAVANIWERRKGLEHVMGLVPLLRADEALVVVGLDEAQRRAAPDGVVALPRTSSAQELAALYSAADVFINPTLEDISSLTNLEAASVGLPVVCFDSGGAPETIEGLAGVVVTDRTPRGLRAGIDQARAAGRDNVGVLQARTAGRRAYESYVDLYERVLAGRTAPEEPHADR